MIRSLVYVVLWTRHHLVKCLLQRTTLATASLVICLGWRLKRYIVSGVPPSESFRLRHPSPIQLPFTCHLSCLRSVFLCANCPVCAHVGDIRGWWLMITVHIDIIQCILLRKFQETSVWVHSTVCNCRRFESLERSTIMHSY